MITEGLKKGVEAWLAAVKEPDARLLTKAFGRLLR